MKDAQGHGNARDRRTLKRYGPDLGARINARRAIDEQATDYFYELVEMIGGAAEIEGTPERSKLWRSVWSMPAYCPERRRQVWNDATVDNKPE